MHFYGVFRIKVPNFWFRWKPPFARKNFLAKELVKISMLQRWAWSDGGAHYDSAFYIYTLVILTVNRRWVATLLEDTDSRKRSAKLPRIYKTWILSNSWMTVWLMFTADSVMARVPQRVWKMFGFYVIKRYEMRLRWHFCTLLARSLLPKNDEVF